MSTDLHCASSGALVRVSVCSIFQHVLSSDAVLWLLWVSERQQPLQYTTNIPNLTLPRSRYTFETVVILTEHLLV